MPDEMKIPPPPVPAQTGPPLIPQKTLAVRFAIVAALLGGGAVAHWLGVDVCLPCLQQLIGLILP